MEQGGDEGPSQEDLDVIRPAIEELCREEDAACFKPSHFKLLYKNYYRTQHLLENATLTGLTSTGLEPGLVDASLAGKGGPPDDLQQQIDADMELASKRISAVIYQKNDATEPERIGTVARVTEGGVCVGATHVFVENGGLLKCKAFESDLALIASFPYYDIILLQGKPGPAFNLQEATGPHKGQVVTMIGYPLAPEEELVVNLPTVARGRIANIASSLELVAADYHGAMPNSSGAPVYLDGCTFAGTHVGTCYHLDGTEETKEELPDEDEVNTDPDRMWTSGASAPRASSSPSKRSGVGNHKAATRPDVDALAAQVKSLQLQVEQVRGQTLSASSNLRHKDQSATYVPAYTIVRLMDKDRSVSGGGDFTPSSQVLC